MNSTAEEEDVESSGDEELVGRCRNEIPHSTQSFQILVRKYEGIVFNTCAKVLGSFPDAEEVSQDVFIKIYHKLHQFEGRSSFKTWLFSIVYNQCLSRLKRLSRQRGREVLLDTQLVDTPEPPQDWGAAHQRERVQAAILQLKPEDREVIVARFISDLSLEQIAEVLDLKLSATKMRLYRAMERFKEVFSLLPDDADRNEQEVTHDQ
ncbi:MAG: sigma-70 family RNA polymerase sigma factor [Verrucomicrobiales bacterium]|nr:sigma-70 family RNA polymerase sigma factor [Verrucomicrobiales bacterium]